MWHTNYTRESYYISTTFCAFPLVGIIFICFAVYYYNESQENYRMYKINKLLDSVDCYGKRMVKYELQNELIVSMVFSFYILILSICGVVYTQNDIYLNDYVKDDFSIYNLGTTLEYSECLAIITLSLDLGIVVVVQTVIVVVVIIKSGIDKFGFDKPIIDLVKTIFTNRRDNDLQCLCTWRYCA